MIDNVEEYQQEAYPGLTVSREGDAIVMRIPVRFHRRNGRQMVLTRGGNGQASPDRETNGSLVSALAKAHRWQEQLESSEYVSLEDLAAANGVDRTYVGRILRLTSLSPEIWSGFSIATSRTGLAWPNCAASCRSYGMSKCGSLLVIQVNAPPFNHDRVRF